MADVACAKCASLFPEEKLNLTEDGMICDLCAVDAEAGSLGAASLLAARTVLLVALGCAVAGLVFDFRQSSSVSFSSGGHGASSKSVSADIPGLILGGVASLAAIFGVFKAWTARDASEGDDPAFARQRWIYVGVGVAIAAFGVFVLMDSMPSSSSKSW